MKKILRLLQWALKAAIFFTLFAFALNNPGDVTLHFFFGTQWSGPLVLMVLGVFAMGVTVGVLGMLPKWWRHRRALKKIQAANANPITSSTAFNPLDTGSSRSTAPTASGLTTSAHSGAPHGI